MTVKTLLIANLNQFFRIIHPKRIQPIMWGLYFWPLTIFIDRGWMSILLATGYRGEAMSWGNRILTKTRSLGPLVQYLDTLLISSKFDEFEKALEQATPNIFARRTGKKRANYLVRRIDDLRIAHAVLNSSEGEFLLPIVENNEFLSGFFSRILWQDHTMRDQSGASRAAEFHLAAANYPVESFTQIWNFLWREYGDADKALRVAGKIEADLNYKIVDLKSQLLVSQENLQKIFEECNADHFSKKIPNDLMSSVQEFFSKEKALNRIKFEIYLNSGMKEELNELVDSGKLKLNSVDLLVKYNSINQIDTASQSYLEHAAKTRHNGGSYDTLKVALGQLAGHFEEEEMVDLALLFYRQAIQHDDESSIITNAEFHWRFLQVLMATGQWDEATYVMNKSQRHMWNLLHSLSTTSRKRRLKNDFKVNPKGALFLTGWGIGDEIARLSILKSIMKPGAKFGYVVDSRIKKLAEKSNPDIEFFSTSKVVGPYAVSKEQYWQDREGVLPQFGHARVTTEILHHIEYFPDIAQSEDLIYHYLKNNRTYTPTTEPILKPDPELIATAKKWLDGLPGKIKVGISWRGGQQTFYRDKTYTSLSEWKGILEIEDICFFNLQYSDTSEEVQMARDQFGVEIHAMPNVDLKDDIEEICALCCAADMVVAPCTAILEFSGACGANTRNIAVASVVVELWRIDPQDGMTDRFYPSLKHVTYNKCGSRKAVLSEIANQISALKEVGHE